MKIFSLFLSIPLVLAGEPRWDSSFHQPFWRKKPEVMARMRKEDLILVSAHTDEVQKEPKLYEMKVVAGGDVRVPVDFAFGSINDYEKLPKADDHFKEVKYDKTNNTVHMKIEALGYKADMTLKVNPIDNNKSKEIDWECIKGSFLGMRGVFQVLEIERQRTEISMTADLKSGKLPLPRVLMGFGLEIIGRQVAIQMKKYITDQYLAEKDHDKRK